MRRLIVAAVGLLALTTPLPAFAISGEVQETEAARMNALAGGPVSARDAELLQRYGCYSGTPSPYCHGSYPRHYYRAHPRAYRR
jgi:hypothetical protein